MYTTLRKTPDIAYAAHSPTEAEEMLLTMLRPYYGDPETLFTLLDALMSYYYDELAA